MDTKKEYTLYWAHIPGKHIDIMSQGYVGVTTDLERRIKEHKTTISCLVFHRALKKYGDDVIFEVIDKFNDQDLAYIIENNYRQKHLTGWNVAVGGFGGSYKRSNKTKKRISESQKGRRHTKASKKKMSEAHKGKKLSEEHKRNIGKARKGIKGIKGINTEKLGAQHHRYGVPVSESTRNKISESMRKYWSSKKQILHLTTKEHIIA